MELLAGVEQVRHRITVLLDTNEEQLIPKIGNHFRIWTFVEQFFVKRS